MTFQVVIEEDLVFVAVFNHEEVMRRFPLDDDDARNDKVLAHRLLPTDNTLNDCPRKAKVWQLAEAVRLGL